MAANSEPRIVIDGEENVEERPQQHVKRRNAFHRTSKQRYQIERPSSLELKTDFANTETKLVVLDFLSNQPIERLTARNDPKLESKLPSRSKTVSSVHEKRSSSDASSYKSYRSRYAKLAKSARPLRKQYSLRLQKDLDEYLKQRGKSLDDLSRYSSSASGESEEDEGKRSKSENLWLLHQRSYTEGDQYYDKKYRQSKKAKRRLSADVQKGIIEFNAEGLNHVSDDEKNYVRQRSTRDTNRPENLTLPEARQRRLSPVLSPESHVAQRLEQISQEILKTYPDFFDEEIIGQVSLRELTYEKFATTAKKVFEKYPGGWTRVALVCYFARELAMEDESTDEQLVQLVEFSSRFISETSADWIASQGGWSALEESDEALSPSVVRQKLKEQPDLVDGILTTGHPGWLSYAGYYGVQLAALAVGMTVAYHYHMTK